MTNTENVAVALYLMVIALFGAIIGVSVTYLVGAGMTALYNAVQLISDVGCVVVTLGTIYGMTVKI